MFGVKQSKLKLDRGAQHTKDSDKNLNKYLKHGVRVQGGKTWVRGSIQGSIHVLITVCNV